MTHKQFYGYLQLARQQLAQHNPQLALETLKQAVKIEPNDPGIYQLLAAAHFDYFQQTQKKEHQKAAKEIVETAIRLNPSDARSFYLKSLILQTLPFGEGKAKARKAIAQALRLDPNNPYYFIDAGKLNRGKVWGKDGSLEYFTRALELAPADSDILSELANHYYFHKSELDTAETYARDSLKFNPQNPMALIVMGHILYKRKKYDEAREHAILVLRQNPRNYDALVLICMLESKRNILIGSSYRLGLWLRRPIPAVCFYVTFMMFGRAAWEQKDFFLLIPLLVPMLYFNIAAFALHWRIKKYLADFQLRRNF